MKGKAAHIVRAGSILMLAGMMVGCQEFGGAGAMNSNSILTVFSGPSPTDAVGMVTNKYNADDRFRGLNLIANAEYGDEDVYVQWYEVAVEDDDPAVRTAAVRALGRHGMPHHVDLVVPSLEDEDNGLRWEAVRALQRLHHEDAIRPLLDRLRPDEERIPDVRAGAATALGQYAEVRVIDGLISAVDDRELVVNRAARQSLVTLTGQDFGYDTAAWVEWRQEATDHFAGRGVYRYPAFSRDATWWEAVVPWLEPPNEVQDTPVGMRVGAGS